MDHLNANVPGRITIKPQPFPSATRVCNLRFLHGVKRRTSIKKNDDDDVARSEPMTVGGIPAGPGAALYVTSP